MVLFRVVMLGDGGVGKSAITVQLVQKKFVSDYDPTIENSYRKPMSFKDGKDEINCMLDILDTAGQEEYSVMRQQYISRGTGFVLVFNLASGMSFNNMRKFRKEIKRVKSLDAPLDQVPIIILGNKCDLPKREVTKEEVKALLEKWGDVPYFETSARTGENINTAFETLVKMMWDREKSPSKGSGELRTKRSMWKKCVIS